uniref:Uncharacterized protein n=1 Tax=Cucumis melo TaxID=3656 RepID=A0A9I9CXR3_CUCME
MNNECSENNSKHQTNTYRGQDRGGGNTYRLESKIKKHLQFTATKHRTKKETTEEGMTDRGHNGGVNEKGHNGGVNERKHRTVWE